MTKYKTTNLWSLQCCPWCLCAWRSGLSTSAISGQPRRAALHLQTVHSMHVCKPALWRRTAVGLRSSRTCRGSQEAQDVAAGRRAMQGLRRANPAQSVAERALRPCSLETGHHSDLHGRMKRLKCFRRLHRWTCVGKRDGITSSAVFFIGSRRGMEGTLRAARSTADAAVARGRRWFFRDAG